MPEKDRATYKDPADFYQAEKYKVRSVRISTPLGWLLPSVDENIKELTKNPHVKEGDLFDPVKAANAYVWLKGQFPELKIDKQSRVAVRFGKNTIENCSEGFLDVVFKLYAFNPSYYYSRSFEFSNEKDLRRETIKTGATEKLARFFVQPYVGYNGTRKFFGGTKFTAKIDDSVIRQVEVDTSGSPNSGEITITASGNKERQSGFVRHLEWRGGYEFSRVPSERTILKSENLFGQFFLASRSITKNELIFRVGGSVEGGDRQTPDLIGVIPANELTDSNVISVKGFAGASMKIGQHTLKSSYGIQLGNAKNGEQIDFIKQISDSAVKLSFPNYRKLSIEAQFTFGDIKSRGNLPVVEKFFGGNKEQSFIEGNSWQIRSNPFIRSFNENKLSIVNNSNILGFDRFASFNFAVSAVAWHRPLVKRKVWEDPNNPGELTPKLRNAINKQFEIAESQIISGYLSETEEYKLIVKSIREMVDPLDRLEKILKKLPVGNPEIKSKLGELFIKPTCSECAPSGKFDIVKTTVTTVDSKASEEKVDSDSIRSLVFDQVPEDPEDGIEPADLNALNRILERIEQLLPQTTADEIADKRGKLNRIAEKIQNDFKKFDTTDLAVKAKKNAVRDLEYPREVLDFLIRKAEMYSIRPVFIFDAAYVKQRLTRDSGMRYGVGGGLKFTFLGLGATGGYVWNPDKRFQEKRGAFLFNLEISDLFK